MNKKLLFSWSFAVIGVIIFLVAILHQLTNITSQQIETPSTSDKSPSLRERSNGLEELLSSSSSVSTSPTPVSSTQLPDSKVLVGGSHAFQTFNNCGPAALSMAMSYLGVQISQHVLGQELRPWQNSQGNNDDKSVTLGELSKRAEADGFLTYHRPAGNISLLQHFIAMELPVITRTWLNANEDIGHYRLVKGYDNITEEIIQDDSLQGKDLRYTNQEFLDLWQAFNYEFLVIVPEDKKHQAEQILGELLDEDSAWQHALKLSETQYLESSISGQKNTQVYAKFNQVVANYHLGNFSQAVSTYEQVADQLPSRMLWYQLEPVLAYYRLGNYQEVLSITNQILNNHNRAYSEVYYLRGAIFEQQYQNDSATAEFAAARKFNNTKYWLNNLKGIDVKTNFN